MIGLAWYWVALIGLLVVLLVAFGAVAVTQELRADTAARRLASAYTAPPLPSATPVATFDQAVARITDSSRPWTLAVVGDSTGYGPDRWVDQLAPMIAKERQRQVVVHDWNDETARYDPARTIGRGGTPITIWNAATPGKTPDYARDRLSTLVPAGVSPDVIIVNHGHNTGPDIAHDMTGLMEALTLRYPDAPIAYTVQNPYLGDDAATQRDRADQERAFAQQGGWRVIDVDKAFRSRRDLASLYFDDRHENRRGGILWARTARAATGI